MRNPVTARRVAVAATLFLVVAAPIVVALAMASVIASLSYLYAPLALLPWIAGILVAPVALLGIAGLLRHRQRASWLLILAAAWIATSATAMGWFSYWPIRSEADATTVAFAGTTAKPVALTMGLVHACALLDDNTVWCWGSNSGGQLDAAGGPFATVAARGTAAPVPGIAGATELTATDHLTCAIAAGRVLCWGGNVWYPGERCLSAGTDASETCYGGPSEYPGLVFASGRLKPGIEAILPYGCSAFSDTVFPCDPLASVTGATSLSLSEQHGCVVASREVWCFGDDSDGELGSGAQPASSEGMVPRLGWGNAVDGIDTALAVSTGPSATCALLAPAAGATRKEIECWGTDAYRAFGLHVPVDTSVPFAIPSGAATTLFPVNPWPLCGPEPVATDAPVGCDSFLRAQPLANGGSIDTQIPASVPAPVTAASSIWSQSCAVAGGSAWCWGFSLGGPSTPLEQMDIAHRVPGLVNVTAISASGASACAIANGVVRCWGLTSSGQLGVPYAAGWIDALALGSLAALLLVAAAAGFGAVRLFAGETRQRASVAFGPDTRVRLAHAATVRLLIATLLSLVVYLWVYLSQGGNGAPNRFPFAVGAGAWAGAVLAIAWGAAGRRVRRRPSLSVAVLALVALTAISAVWIVPTLIGVFTGSLPQPIAASPLPEAILVVPVALVGLLVFFVPPVDPLLARDFAIQYREARTARRQISFLLHPWRFLSARAAEKERARLAAELHAGVLPGLYRSLKEVEKGGSVERLALDLREAVEEVEGMLARRRSIVLEEVGLLGAVEWLAERTEERSSVTVEIDVDGAGDAGRAPRTVERAAFRVAQLALDNCAKHAPGCTVRVRLGASPTRVALVVSDDGPGLTQTPAEAVMAGRNGLADMDDEARACGARLTIASGDQGAERPGVTVSFEWRA